MAFIEAGPENPIRKMLPIVLSIMATAFTVFMCVRAVQTDRTLAWALPGLVYLAAAITIMTPLGRRPVPHRALAAIMVLDAVAIGASLYFLLDHQPAAFFFGAMFLMFPIMEFQLPPEPKST